MRVTWDFRFGPRAAALLLGACLAAAPVAAAHAEEAAPSEPKSESPGEVARQSLEKMMRALSLLVESIPQYELPEVLDNGDIIIRRKNPESDSAEPEFDETAT